MAEKVFVLGVDGLDPRYSKKMLGEGKMPNLQKFIDRGAAREDLVLLGGHPTVTPPMWTTLATGCYANVHGITAFFRQGSDLDKIVVNFDSRNCKAEPLWNILAEAGIKTAVFHWPGNAWPPTSPNENLLVLDGSTPGSIGMGAATLAGEFMAVADVKIEQVTFAPSATADLDKACVVKPDPSGGGMSQMTEGLKMTNEAAMFILSDREGMGAACIDDRFSLSLSPVKETSGWAGAPAGAKEFTLLLSAGFLRRPCLILKNEAGVYDRVALYRSKKDAEPFAILEEGKIKSQIYDQAVAGDGVHKAANYNMKLLKIAPDGSHVEMYISNAVDMHADYIFSPGNLFYELAENVGYFTPGSVVGNHDPKIVTDCMLDCWEVAADWQAKAIHYLIEKKGVEAIFSHFHNVDMQEHRFIRFMVDSAGYEQGPVEMYRKFLDDVYEQTDRYLGRFLHLLDEGWTVIITSDHAQVCPAHKPPLIGDMQVNVRVMEELGYTFLKRDADGQEIREIDWARTKAVAVRECNIYINLKGRDPHGIVDPADKYELEEQIMTDLYGYRDKVTGKRVIALALRNKDAVLLGYGGPDCGDICYWIAEGYNIDHADGLSTAYGECETSLSPIFVAAGPGIKAGYTTDRYIRQIDVTPTIAALMNVRMPDQCEGAPVYQIFAEEF
ncbi:MAG: alkaline phosphatase family protein [Gracilibacteraceae bacterium]|jgi:predicted AlkP superfamily phosphohydrolase/phosphomutase|nr:alkaline phosphatase family protein [Gracilibacteraceae bacterium]